MDSSKLKALIHMTSYISTIWQRCIAVETRRCPLSPGSSQQHSATPLRRQNSLQDFERTEILPSWWVPLWAAEMFDRSLHQSSHECHGTALMEYSEQRNTVRVAALFTLSWKETQPSSQTNERFSDQVPRPFQLELAVSSRHKVWRKEVCSVDVKSTGEL